MNELAAPDDRLKRAQAGDGGAFDELLAPVLDPGFRLAMTMLNDRSAAEDAVHQRVPVDAKEALVAGPAAG